MDSTVCPRVPSVKGVDPVRRNSLPKNTIEVPRYLATLSDESFRDYRSQALV